MKIDRLIGNPYLSRLEEKELIKSFKRQGVRFYFIKKESQIHFKAKFAPPDGGGMAKSVPINKDNFPEAIKEMKDYVFRFLIVDAFSDIYAHDREWFKRIDSEFKTTKDVRESKLTTQELWVLLKKEHFTSYPIWTFKSAISVLKMAYNDSSNIAFAVLYCTYTLTLMPFLPFTQIYGRFFKQKSLLRISD